MESLPLSRNERCVYGGFTLHHHPSTVATYRYTRTKNGITSALKEIPTSVAIPAAGIASAIGGVEAYRQVAFEGLPSHVIEQLKTDGMHGGRRNLGQAQEHYELNVNSEAKGSLDGVEAITNDPSLDAMHLHPHSDGGSAEASNIVYGPESLNSQIGDRVMSSSEVQLAEEYTAEVAESATPGVTGDLTEVVGDTFETGAYGAVIGGGLALAHRYAQAQGYRDSGRHDLAAMAESELANDARKGVVNGVVRGTTVAVTQAILGANPLTAGIGLVAPDALMLLTKKDQLSEAEYQQKSLEVVGKGALATILVCAGPVGWLGLAGFSIAAAYGKASQQAANARTA